MDNQPSYGYSQSSFNPLIIVIVILTILVVGVSGFSIWAYTNYLDQKDNVDQKVNTAVANAQRQQVQVDTANFTQQQKLPYQQFVGPNDLGQVTFNYPKTWSAYIGRDGSDGSGNYEAYFDPGTVPPLGSGNPYSLRITVENKTYDTVLASFQQAVQKGNVKASTETVDGQVGTRLTGAIEPNISGIMILLKIRDTTLMVYTESPTFQPDFDNTIIPSLTFNS